MTFLKTLLDMLFKRKMVRRFLSSKTKQDPISPFSFKDLEDSISKDYFRSFLFDDTPHQQTNGLQRKNRSDNLLKKEHI